MKSWTPQREWNQVFRKEWAFPASHMWYSSRFTQNNSKPVICFYYDENSCENWLSLPQTARLLNTYQIHLAISRSWRYCALCLTETQLSLISQSCYLFTSCESCKLKPCAGLKVWPATAPPRSEDQGRIQDFVIGGEPNNLGYRGRGTNERSEYKSAGGTGAL